MFKDKDNLKAETKFEDKNKQWCKKQILKKPENRFNPRSWNVVVFKFIVLFIHYKYFIEGYTSTGPCRGQRESMESQSKSKYVFSHKYGPCLWFIVMGSVYLTFLGTSPALHSSQAYSWWDASGYEEGAQSKRDATVQHHVHVQAWKCQVTWLFVAVSLSKAVLLK